MAGRSKALESALAAVVGLVLGLLGSIALAMLWAVEGWPLLVPMGVGLVAGGLFGDRGIRSLARVLGWM